MRNVAFSRRDPFGAERGERGSSPAQSTAGGEEMTKRELSQLYWLNREIRQDQERLRELEEAAEAIVPRYGEGVRSGPRDRVGDLALLICEQRMLIERKRQRACQEQNRLCRYVSGIEDSLMRQIIALRYLDGLSWNQVAQRIGGVTEDSVRMAHNRFLRKK